MWWRRAAGLLLIQALGLALSACGFRPMYGVNSYDPDVAQELAQIRVEPIKDRQGQLIRNALANALSPSGEPVHWRYHLDVFLQVSESQEAISSDNTSTRDAHSVHVTFRLYDGNTAIVAGDFTQVSSFNFLQQHYSNIAAEEDVKNRAGPDIANEIRNRLAAYFITTRIIRDTEAAKKQATATP